MNKFIFIMDFFNFFKYNLMYLNKNNYHNPLILNQIIIYNQ